MIAVLGNWYIARNKQDDSTQLFMYQVFDGYYIHGIDTHGKLVVLSDCSNRLTEASELLKALM
jgi:hypothetical protein